MKCIHSLLLVGALCGASGVAMASGSALASSAALSPFPLKVLPVLVKVNSHGKVTDVSPAVSLSPQFNRLLSANLNEMITKPAYIHGRPVSTQFVINLSVHATPRDNGDYDAQFSYVSTEPVPSGTWHWVNIEGRRFALAGPDSFRQEHRYDGPRDFHHYAPPANQNQRSYNPPSQNVQRAAAPAPASAPSSNAHRGR